MISDEKIEEYVRRVSKVWHCANVTLREAERRVIRSMELDPKEVENICINPFALMDKDTD